MLRHHTGQRGTYDGCRYDQFHGIGRLAWYIAVGMAQGPRLQDRACSPALRQVLHELARGPQVGRFKSFREAAVYESKVLVGLIALSAFSEQPR